MNYICKSIGEKMSLTFYKANDLLSIEQVHNKGYVEIKIRELKKEEIAALHKFFGDILYVYYKEEV